LAWVCGVLDLIGLYPPIAKKQQQAAREYMGMLYTFILLYNSIMAFRFPNPEVSA
jgi:hypothetical protein